MTVSSRWIRKILLTDSMPCGYYASMVWAPPCYKKSTEVML